MIPDGRRIGYYYTVVKRYFYIFRKVLAEARA